MRKLIFFLLYISLTTNLISQDEPTISAKDLIGNWRVETEYIIIENYFYDEDWEHLDTLYFVSDTYNNDVGDPITNIEFLDHNLLILSRQSEKMTKALYVFSKNGPVIIFPIFEYCLLIKDQLDHEFLIGLNFMSLNQLTMIYRLWSWGNDRENVRETTYCQAEMRRQE